MKKYIIKLSAKRTKGNLVMLLPNILAASTMRNIFKKDIQHYFTISFVWWDFSVVFTIIKKSNKI